MTSDIFLIRGILGTLKYSNVGGYLDPCQTYRKVFGTKFQAIIIFTGRSFLDHFYMFGRILNASIYLQFLVILYSYFRFCFRPVQTYWNIVQEHNPAYSEPWVSLAYLEPWQILITKYIQTPRYIHNAILNIFTKAPSWTFNTVLNMSHLFLLDAM